jgi:hypothetical protein
MPREQALERVTVWRRRKRQPAGHPDGSLKRRNSRVAESQTMRTDRGPSLFNRGERLGADRNSVGVDFSTFSFDRGAAPEG